VCFTYINAYSYYYRLEKLVGPTDWVEHRLAVFSDKKHRFLPRCPNARSDARGDASITHTGSHMHMLTHTHAVGDAHISAHEDPVGIKSHDDDAVADDAVADTKNHHTPAPTVSSSLWSFLQAHAQRRALGANNLSDFADGNVFGGRKSSCLLGIERLAPTAGTDRSLM
jgi:hypothetical protein